MSKIVWFAGSLTGALMLSSCVTYPYDSAFNSCEREANACYRLCEDIPDEGGYVACQSHCDRDIDRCFDQAYSPYRSGYGYGGYGSGYGYGSPWYGSYGSWYPDTGYFLSFNYYDRYGYRKQRYRPRNDYDNRGGGSRPGYDGGGSVRPRYDRPRDPDAVPPRPSSSGVGSRDRDRNRGYNAPTTTRRSVDPDAPDPRPSSRRAPTPTQPTYSPPPNSSQPPSASPPSGATPPSSGGSRRAPSERATPDAPDRDHD
jgi:hypothetical protein